MPSACRLKQADDEEESFEEDELLDEFEDDDDEFSPAELERLNAAIKALEKPKAKRK
jgi:hypothetical protein